jgi:hypothetical protein
MSDGSRNPYESPQAEAGTVNPLSGRVLTEEMLYYLRGASPWLRFIGIAGFIGLGAAVLMILLVFFFIGRMLPDSPETAPFRTIMPGMSIIYLPFLAIYFFPILFLFRFGTRIKSYLYSGDTKDLEEALKNNKSLWTFMGVITIIGLSFTALTLVGVIIAAAFGAFA